MPRADRGIAVVSLGASRCHASEVALGEKYPRECHGRQRWMREWIAGVASYQEALSVYVLLFHETQVFNRINSSRRRWPEACVTVLII